MVSDAFRFVIPAFVLALVCALFRLWAPGSLLFLAGCFICYFFRNPRREVPQGGKLVLSPADGKVVRITGPIEQDGEGHGQLISIFLSLFDVHVNRSPVEGVLERVEHRRGRFKAAFKHEASQVNEQNILTIRGRESKLVVKQIAGVLARRVVCWKSPGQAMERGEAIGLIRFGSRVEVLLPSGVQVLVRVGDRVKGGVSILGEYV
jgi:phosphatidylserine decarboxylase